MSEGAIHYVVLESALVPLAVNFYTEVFKALSIHNYDDGSVQLRINDSFILVTPGSPSNSVVIELLLDRDSLQKIRQDSRFVEIERSTVKMMQDPFGVFWLLTEYQKEFSDVYRHIDSCENCNLERHLPALCDEMKTWACYLDIYKRNNASEITLYFNEFASVDVEKTLVIYRSLQEGMSQIRNLRFLYESADFVRFTNHPYLRALFDELERINSFRQALAVTLFFNPTMIDEVALLDKWKNSVEDYASLVFGKIGLPSSNNPVDSDILPVRSHLADCFRQLVKRMQTARMVMNKKRLGISNDEPWRPTPQEKWMADILYKDVDYWRTQKY